MQPPPEVPRCEDWRTPTQVQRELARLIDKPPKYSTILGWFVNGFQYGARSERIYLKRFFVRQKYFTTMKWVAEFLEKRNTIGVKRDLRY